MDAIARAHHYVHIEQQFFISGTAGGGVRNRVAAALIARVERAVRERAPFRINVIMPLLPSFPGTPQEDFTVRLPTPCHLGLVSYTRQSLGFVPLPLVLAYVAGITCTYSLCRRDW